MQGGAILADGAPDQILQPDLMAQVFAVGFARYDGADGPIWSVTELERSA